MNIKIGNVNYDCLKYGTTELADLQDWMQERREDKIIKRASKIYGDNLPDRIYDEISREITLDDLGDAITSDMRSIEYLVYLTIKKTNPTITLEAISSGIGGFTEAIKIVSDLSPTATSKKKTVKKK